MMLKLDGSKLEGGGQLTRMALCLSAITNQAIIIHSIRAGRAARTPKAHKTKDRHDRKSERPHPVVAGGLKESHLAALQWLAAMTFADVDGAQMGSTEITFRPSELKGKFGPGVPERARTFEAQRATGETVVDTIRLKNPGSIWLIFQAIFPYMVFSSTLVSSFSDSNGGNDQTRNTDKPDDANRVLFDLTLIGGTNVPKSMSTEYVQQVFLPICAMIGLPRVRIDTVRSGWTTGHLEVGEVRVRMYAAESTRVQPVDALPSPLQLQSQSQSQPVAPENVFKLPAFTLTDRGEITQISITILSTPHLFSTLTDYLTTALTTHPRYTTHNQPTITASTTDSRHERRTYILLVAHTSTGLRLGRDYLGDGGKPKFGANILEAACRNIVDKLMRELDSGACVDKYMQDQVVAFQALADGSSQVRGDSDEAVISGIGTLAIEDQDIHDDEGESGDQSGTLHTRTVRWVCERILNVRFGTGGICRVREQEGQTGVEE